MKRIIIALSTIAGLILGTAPAYADQQLTARTHSDVQQHSYVELTVTFSEPVGYAKGLVTATAYVGRCRHLHCQYRTFTLVPYTSSRKIWIDTEIVNAPGTYTITSVQVHSGININHDNGPKLPVHIVFTVTP